MMQFKGAAALFFFLTPNVCLNLWSVQERQCVNKQSLSCVLCLEAYNNDESGMLNIAGNNKRTFVETKLKARGKINGSVWFEVIHNFYTGSCGVKALTICHDTWNHFSSFKAEPRQTRFSASFVRLSDFLRLAHARKWVSDICWCCLNVPTMLVFGGW